MYTSSIQQVLNIYGSYSDCIRLNQIRLSFYCIGLNWVWVQLIICSHMMSEKVTVGYWRFRGRAQVIRLLLAYTGAIWEDVQYTHPDQWFSDGALNLGLQFPNMPYLIEGNFKMTESEAIIRYVVERAGKDLGLLGKSLQEKAIVNNLIGVISEIISLVGALPYDKQYENKKASVWNKVKPKFDNLAKFKGEKQWLMPYLTVPDFLLSELSYYVEKVYPEHYEKMGFLQAERASFQNLSQIKKYYEQESSIKGPFCAPHAAVIKF